MNEALRPIPPAIIDAAVRTALEEDGAYDDITTAAVVDPAQWARGVLVVRESGVLAGLPVAAAAFTALSPEVSFDALIADGERVAGGTEVAEVEGPVAPLLASERVALNFLQRMSGIATLTRDFADAVRGTSARILDTRKTTPGLRHFERYAVRAGGGHNHRFGLSSGLLIKDNHIAAARQAGASTLGEVVLRARAAAPHTLRIEIEVTSLDELEEALEARPDIILLDNMSVDDARRAVELAGDVVLEVSGGVTLDNVGSYADAGVQYISVGRLTHSAPALDISLELSGA